jgi:hypothetical protein
MHFDTWAARAAEYLATTVFLKAGIPLPEVTISLRGRGSRPASCHADGWFDSSRNKAITEISFSPAAASTLAMEEMIAVLAHELLHAADFAAGTAVMRGRHGGAWVRLASLIGLEPIFHDRTTRYRVGHRVIDGGLVAEAIARWPTDLVLTGRPRLISRRSDRKVAYHFRCCQQTVYGPPNMRLRCDRHDESFSPQQFKQLPNLLGGEPTSQCPSNAIERLGSDRKGALA